MRKVALLSRVLPPSSSGQSVVLYKLLETVPQERYCLISQIAAQTIAKEDIATEKLPGKHFYLTSIRGYPISRLNIFPCLQTTFSTGFEIISRARQIAAILKTEKCSTLVVCSGDLPDLPAGALACHWEKRELILYLFDDYANQWMGTNRRLSRLLEPYVVKMATKTIVPNEAMEKSYFRRYGISPIVIRNPAKVESAGSVKTTVKKNKVISIVFTGAIYNAHYGAFRGLVEALRQDNSQEIELHLYSGARKADLEREKILGPKVFLHDHIHHSQIELALQSADILYLPLAFDSPIKTVIKTASPGKMGELLAVRKPILVHAPSNSFISCYFRTHGCGLVVDKNDPAILCQAIKRLVSEPDLREKLSDKAFLRAQKDFEINQVRSKFLETLGI